MAIKEDLESRVGEIFSKSWNIRDGKVVPDDSSVTLGNVGVRIEATILYADLSDSTDLVDRYSPQFAAEIYKTYLHCAATIIRSSGGEIRSYDGDRIMAIFIGDAKNSVAVKAALKIHYAVANIINPGLLKQYRDTNYQVQQVVGIDTSWVMAAKTGVRSAND